MIERRGEKTCFSSLPAINSSRWRNAGTVNSRTTKLSPALSRYDYDASHLSNGAVVTTDVSPTVSRSKILGRETESISLSRDVAERTVENFVDSGTRLGNVWDSSGDSFGRTDRSTLRPTRSLDVNTFMRQSSRDDSTSNLSGRTSKSLNPESRFDYPVLSRESISSYSRPRTGVDTCLTQQHNQMAVRGKINRHDTGNGNTTFPLHGEKHENEEFKATQVTTKRSGDLKNRFDRFEKPVSDCHKGRFLTLPGNFPLETRVRKTETGLEIVTGRANTRRQQQKSVSYSQIRVQNWVDSQRSLLRKSLIPEAVR